MKEILEVRTLTLIVQLINCTLGLQIWGLEVGGRASAAPGSTSAFRGFRFNGDTHCILRVTFRFDGDTHCIRNRIIRCDSTHVSLRSVGW